MTEACCHKPSTFELYKSKALLSAVLLLAAWGISLGFDGLQKFRQVLEHDFHMMALPLLAGLVLGGAVDAWVPSSWITAWLTGNRKRSLIYSAGLGFLMSSCSHGLVAIAMQLYKKGASRASVISFLLASPWANLAMTFLLIGFFKAWGLVIIVGAIVIALITGFIFQRIESTGWFGVVRSPSPELPVTGAEWWYQLRTQTISGHLRAILRETFNLSEMVLPWIVLGIFLAAVSTALVPEAWFKSYLGNSVLGLFSTLGLATVIEVCSEGMSFLAFELYKQTGAMGNACVFLMAGVVTDFTEISLIWKNMGWKPAIMMVLITLPQVLLLGYLINLFAS